MRWMGAWQTAASAKRVTIWRAANTGAVPVVHEVMAIDPFRAEDGPPRAPNRAPPECSSYVETPPSQAVLLGTAGQAETW